MLPPKGILVDARNYEQVKDHIINEIKSATLIGFDLETQDVEAHEGIKLLRKEDEDGNKTAKGKSVFDWRAMRITGFSMYPDGAENAYYFNLLHADVQNRLSWEQVRIFVDAKPATSSYVCHNAPFEITVMALDKQFKMQDVICTLQMAVSTYGPDEYNRDDYDPAMLGHIPELFGEAETIFSKIADVPDVDADVEETKSNRLNSKQNELLLKVIGKQSKAAYSYNGLMNQLSYSYGLKKMVMKFFDYQMTTFDEVLNGKNHMGELTGEEVVAYGCDDAFWAVQLFYKLYNMMDAADPSKYEGATCPSLVKTFFEQENPMIYVYSQIRQDGMKVDKSAIERRRAEERTTFAQKVRDMKAVARLLLPFTEEPNAKLCADKWYKDGYAKYRTKFEQWLKQPDSADDFTMACQVSSPVSNAWAGHKCAGISIGHYFQTRLMMYDLCRLTPIMYKGKVQSDGDTRGDLRDRLKGLKDKPEVDQVRVANADKLIKLMGELASVEQRMKLYLTPYLLLTDPETSRMYPEVTSMLASRRMAASNPNPMQLAKRGESTYVRGFYEADAEDEVTVSLDWSQVELVEIGEFSGDPEFAKAFGQLPYNDLHLGAAADVLSVVIPEVNFDMLKNMHTMDAKDLPPKLLIKPNGEPLTPKDAKKFWRTEVGKGSNFNYWYSGALSTVGEKLGWTSDQMWKATEVYRERFPVAEAWRVNTIEFARWNGYVVLPDGHKRVRWEATYEWSNLTNRMFESFESAAITRFGSEIVRSIKSRAGNQIVNSLIQGSSATLAKRSILAINKKIEELGLRARFKMPVHDELIFSVHKDDVVAFIKMAKSVMCHHPEIIKTLLLNATASVGLTFQPYDVIKAPIGQIELDEAPPFLGFGDGVILNDAQTEHVIEYLFKKRLELRGQNA